MTVPRRPFPFPQVKEARRADDGSVLPAVVHAVIHAAVHGDDPERYSAARFTPGDGGVDVAGGFDLALRDGTPLVERTIDCRSGCQAVNMTAVNRFEAHVRARQHRIFCSHVPSMLCVALWSQRD